MSASNKTSSTPSGSASRPAIKKTKRSVVPNERISPAVGSATDHASDPVARSRSSSSTPAPGSSSKSKRVKVSAKSVAIPASASEPTTKPKAKKIKRVVHVFGPSKSKLSGTLSRIQAPSGTSDSLELLVPEPGSYKLKPQRREDVDAMLTLDDFPGFFDDELAEEFHLEEEEEARSDSELGSASGRTELPPMPEGSPPAANEPPLPSEAPPVDFVPDPPVDGSSSFPASASTPSLPRVGEKRGRGVDATSSADPPFTRPRIEAELNEDRSNVASESRTIPDVEGADRSAKDTDPSSRLGEGIEPVFAGGDGFAHALEEGNEHGFYFAYNGAVPNLNHKGASAGFQRAVYEAYHGEGGPSELVLADEIAQLARLEQRVAFKRTHLSFTYETLLVKEKRLAEDRLRAVEREKDAALAKVKELEAGLASAKRSKKLKQRLEKADAENADLKKRLEEVEVQKGDLQKALEAEVESSKARDLILQSARKAEEANAKELAELRADYDQLSEVGAVEVKLLLDRLFMVKERFRDLRAASETRLGKLKAYLDEREFVKEKYLLFNQMKGVFGTIERLKTLHAIDTPPIFERRCREMEGKLERWLGDRPQLSYEASDFELPAELEIDSLLAFLVEPTDDDTEKVLGGATDEGEEVDDDDLGEDEVAGDEVVGDEETGDRGAGDANLPEE
ncbi:unnamed protein product [Cochlearia groenlandica]